METILEGDNRLKLIIAGLVLAAVAVVYLIFSQRFSANYQNKGETGNVPVAQMQPTVTPTPSVVTPTPSPTPTPPPTGGSVGPTTKGGQPLPNTGVSSLPATGFPAGLTVVFSVSATTIGWFLRKYPR